VNFFMKNPALPLFLVFLLAGCSTVTTYKPKTADGHPKPAGYPILVLAEDETVPRPSEVIGTIQVGSSEFTTFGGSAESETKKILRVAHERGADAVRMISVQKPGWLNPNFTLSAELLRYTDTWETVTMSAEKFAAYLKTNAPSLDPIEGVWAGRGESSHWLGIVRDSSRPGRDFVGYILSAQNTSWRPGYKKMDIRRSSQPGVYFLTYYLDDFSRWELTFRLGDKKEFLLAIQRDDTGQLVIYSKN